MEKFRVDDLAQRADRLRLQAQEWEKLDPTMAKAVHAAADKTLLKAASGALHLALSAFLGAILFTACAQIDDAIGYDPEPDPSSPAVARAPWEPQDKPELGAALCLVQHTLSAQTWSCIDHAYAPGALEDDWVQNYECLSVEGGSVTMAKCRPVTLVGGEQVTQCTITGDVEGYANIVPLSAAYHSTFGPARCDLETGAYQ